MVYAKILVHFEVQVVLKKKVNKKEINFTLSTVLSLKCAVSFYDIIAD